MMRLQGTVTLHYGEDHQKFKSLAGMKLSWLSDAIEGWINDEAVHPSRITMHVVIEAEGNNT